MKNNEINPEHYQYAKKMSELGDKIQKVADKFAIKIDTPPTIESVKHVYDTCVKNIDGYKECKSDLFNIKPPAIVQEEHNTEMANELQSYIDGTELMYKAADIEKGTINMEMYLKGELIQDQAKNKIVDISKRIGDKLLGG